MNKTPPSLCELLAIFLCCACATDASRQPLQRPVHRARAQRDHSASAPLPDRQSVCFASHEIECWSPSGGMGRALLRQAAFLKRNNFSVKLILLRTSAEVKESSNDLCHDKRDADLVVSDVHVAPKLDASLNFHPSIHPSLQLLTWLQSNPNKCSILHVPDFGGQAALPAVAKQAGLAYLDKTHINIQVHGSDSVINHAVQLIMEPPLLYIDAMERMQMKHADSAVFLSRENRLKYDDIWQLPPRVDIIPNLLVPAKGRVYPKGESAWWVDVRHIFFYGKMTDAKGLGLFVRGIKLCPPQLLDGKTIHLVGPRTDDENYLEELNALRLLANVTLLAHYGLPTEEVVGLFRSHLHDGMVVLPSLIEHQSYALFDVFRSGAPFVASKIFAHQADIPNQFHRRLLFDVTPMAMAVMLSSYLKDGLEWSPAQTKWLPTHVAERRWIKWHRAMLGTLASHARRPALARVDVSVAIAVCRTTNSLRRALLSVQRQESPLSGDIDVQVVASCPAFSTCDAVRPVLSQLPTTAGVAVGCVDTEQTQRQVPPVMTRGQASNFAVANAKHDIVLLIGENDELADGALIKFTNALSLNPNHGVVSSFVDVFAAGAHRDTPTYDRGKMTTVFLGPAPEVGFVANELGPKQMLIDRTNVFWNASGGFSEEAMVECEEWGLLQKAALANAMLLIPEALVTHQGTDDDRTGWSLQVKRRKNIAYVHCRTFTVRDAVLFMSRLKGGIDMRFILTDMLFLFNFVDRGV